MSPADMDSLRFIDTVGWEDADADDLDTFQSMLRALNRYNLTKLRAVIWTLHPGTIRKTEGVARMARLIEQFDERGRIWDNVILICKCSHTCACAICYVYLACTDGRDGYFISWPEWGILTPYPEAEWVFSPKSIMPPRPIERSSRAEGA